METIGWIGGMLLATCAFPQVIKVWRDGNADGMSHLNVWLWCFGEIFMLAYVLLQQFSFPLLLNYGLNLIFVLIIIYFKYFNKENNDVSI